jgi:hypothetical protein
MRITSAGNVGIGLTPSQRFQVGFSAGADQLAVFRDDSVYTPNGGVVIVNRYNDTTDIGGIKISSGTATSGFITFHSGGTTERMRIHSNGDVSINCTAVPDDPNAGDKGAFSGSDGYFAVGRNVDGASVIAQFFGRTGQVNFDGDGDLKNTNNSYGGISDRALKENETNANSQWNDIKALQIKNYNFIGFPNKKQIGVIAQDLEASGMNGLVKEMKDYENIEVPILDDNGNPVLNEDGTPQVKKERIELDTTTKSVKYSVLYMKAIKALQEAMVRIEQLETKNISLEARLTALES